MAYVTSDEFDDYLETYGGTNISGLSNFEQLLELATLDINTATYNRINNINNLTTFQQTHVKNAVCSHAQTLNDYGDTGSLISDKRRVSLGDLSVDGSSDNILDRMSNRTKDFLQRTGLASRSLSFDTYRGYWDRL